jgi:Tol biopolymer transport system component
MIRVRTLAALAASTLVLASCATVRVSLGNNDVQGNESSLQAQASPNGRFVVFQSQASNLVANDSSNGTDTFVHDTQLGITARASVASDGTQQLGISVGSPFFSDDARWVEFTSSASNLAPNDNNGVAYDVFLHDVVGGTTTLISRSSTGAAVGGEAAGVSSDGRSIYFSSPEAGITPGDDTPGVFRVDRTSGRTTRMASTQCPPNTRASVYSARVSNDEQHVTFKSTCQSVTVNYVLYDIATHTYTTLHTWNPGNSVLDLSTPPSIAADGSTVTWVETGRPPYITTSTLYVWRAPGPAQAITSAVGFPTASAISPNGRYLAYVGGTQAYVLDRTTGRTVNASTNTSGKLSNGASDDPVFSRDGSHLLFESTASDLVAGDTNNHEDVFMRPVSSLFGSSTAGAARVGR